MAKTMTATFPFVLRSLDVKQFLVFFFSHPVSHFLLWLFAEIVARDMARGPHSAFSRNEWAGFSVGSWIIFWLGRKL